MLGELSASGRVTPRKGMGPQTFDRFAAIEFNLQQIDSELTAWIRQVTRAWAGYAAERSASRSSSATTSPGFFPRA